MTNHKISEPLFKIDYNKWDLLKNPETGLLIEPVPIEDFDRFEYWSDELNRPVRQIISKKKRRLYADYLNLNTASLYRRVSSLLGVSPYDDEISKEKYEELCQIALLKHNYQKQINYEILIPFQSLALTFLKYKEKTLIRKANTLYEVNCEKQRVEKTSLISENIIDKAKGISEYEFYYSVIQTMIEKNGEEFLSNNRAL
ncbi:hypothetical protein [Spongiimicrobium sp. 2-473A-2-J]|uniref:hypothetical protein n=1 Tax=Eudoraea algarum TaxID=3417568 RepID=UPI003D364CC8